MTTAIVWLRQDLRTMDNPALTYATENHQKVIPLYLLDKQHCGQAQAWWLHHTLKALQTALVEQGLGLCLQKGEPLTVLKRLIKEQKVTAIYWNRCYEPQAIARDKVIMAAVLAMAMEVQSFNGSLLNEPWTVLTENRAYFKIFTPYWRKASQQVIIPPTMKLHAKAQYPKLKSDALEDWQLLPKSPNWAAEFNAYWAPGEEAGMKKLHQFIEEDLQNYKKKRDELALSVTSHLSPHLHFGEISPWAVWRATQAAKLHKGCDLASAEHFLSEIGWREFAYYLLYHFPALPTQNFKANFDRFPWTEDTDFLKAWQQGRTGYPVVDAGMRQLWRTGYMHNRVRMITASFLIKDGFIDWRQGAAWFMHTLLDADLANNSAAWQWVAGSGSDAAPYFRIFNPVLQGEKYDPEGLYVKRWLPELADVPKKWIHKPWEAPKGALTLTLGKDYPYPIVDHGLARQHALESFRLIKQ